jgi:hypothetical protein
MFEKPPSVERGPERHPTEEEVLGQFEKFIHGREFFEIKKEFDETGLKDWEIRITNEDGSTTEYVYGRAGEYGPHKRNETAIQVAHFDADGLPEGSNSVAKYRDGKWVETR